MSYLVSSCLLLITFLIVPCDGGEVVLEEDSGFIVSPNFPNSYDNNLNCLWNIKTTENSRVILRFVKFDVVCGGDFVAMREVDKRLILNKTCGTNCQDVISTLISETNDVVVLMVTDGSTRSPGFNLTWTVCGGKFQDMSGLIQTPPLQFEYDSFYCYFHLINPYVESTFQIDFGGTNFETDLGDCLINVRYKILNNASDNNYDCSNLGVLVSDTNEININIWMEFGVTPQLQALYQEYTTPEGSSVETQLTDVTTQYTSHVDSTGLTSQSQTAGTSTAQSQTAVTTAQSETGGISAIPLIAGAAGGGLFLIIIFIIIIVFYLRRSRPKSPKDRNSGKDNVEGNGRLPNQANEVIPLTSSHPVDGIAAEKEQNGKMLKKNTDAEQDREYTEIDLEIETKSQSKQHHPVYAEAGNVNHEKDGIYEKAIEGEYDILHQGRKKQELVDDKNFYDMSLTDDGTYSQTNRMMPDHVDDTYDVSKPSSGHVDNLYDVTNPLGTMPTQGNADDTYDTASNVKG